MNSRLRAIVELAKMRFRLFYREPGAMFWTFGFPIVLSLILGTAFRNRQPDPVIVAVEASASAEHARAVLAAASGVKVAVLSPEQAAGALRTGRVSLVVVANGAEYTYRFDPTRPESQLARAVTDDALQRGEGRRDAYTPAVQTVTEPGSRYIDFLIPGLIGLGLMSTGLWGIGFTLAEMRSKKLIKRLTATPMRRSDLLFSFLLVRAAMLPFEVVPILAFSRWVFVVDVRGNLGALLFAVELGGLTFAALGLLIASRTASLQIVMGTINVVSFPMYLCSGVFFASSRFPDAIQPLVRHIPLTVLNDVLRAIMVDGASLAAVGPRLAEVAAWGLAAFVVAVRVFRWR